MPEIVIRDRVVPRLLALVPALFVVAAVRLLTIGEPPAGLKVLGAVVVAGGAWTAYRLLTARVVVGEAGVHVRGILYEADIPWTELEEVTTTQASTLLRVLMSGIVEPWSVSLAGRTRRLRPVAMLSGPNDETIERAIGAMRVRLGTRRVPDQRRSGDGAASRRGINA